ncbi:18071_t:CDS:2, partial [Gigaspora rosea]
AFVSELSNQGGRPIVPTKDLYLEKGFVSGVRPKEQCKNMGDRYLHFSNGTELISDQIVVDSTSDKVSFCNSVDRDVDDVFLESFILK